MTATAPRPAVRLLLSDVDGTLLTSGKELTPATVDAVRRLRAAGVRFTVTSSRPPAGLAMLVEPLAIDAPIGAFNGGVFVDPDLRVLDQHPLGDEVAAAVIGLLDDHGLDPWVYTAAGWYVRDLDGPHVQHEATVTRFAPTRTDDLLGVLDGGAAKLVGVSDDPTRVVRAETVVTEALGTAVSATRSQAYYLDVTDPGANKGAVVDHLARTLGIPASTIATVGDGQNDTLMFARSGTSIAMGNAAPDVQARATHVTAPNDADGFARAVDQFVLPQ